MHANIYDIQCKFNLLQDIIDSDVIYAFVKLFLVAL